MLSQTIDKQYTTSVSDGQASLALVSEWSFGMLAEMTDHEFLPSGERAYDQSLLDLYGAAVAQTMDHGAEAWTDHMIRQLEVDHGSPTYAVSLDGDVVRALIPEIAQAAIFTDVSRIVVGYCPGYVPSEGVEELEPTLRIKVGYALRTERFPKMLTLDPDMEKGKIDVSYGWEELDEQPLTFGDVDDDNELNSQYEALVRNQNDSMRESMNRKNGPTQYEIDLLKRVVDGIPVILNAQENMQIPQDLS